jgi:hypothetical protein
MRAALVLMALALSGGCTAAKATVQIVTAEQALGRAREHEAAELATYEYTMAVRYLEKSKEEAGYSDYKTSESLARQAADWADQSIIAIERGGRGVGMEEAGSELSDVPSARPPPAPASAPTPESEQEEQDLEDILGPPDSPVEPPLDDVLIEDLDEENP